MKSFTPGRKKILKLGNWLQNVVKQGKYSLAKYEKVYYINVLSSETAVTFETKWSQKW